MNHDDDEPYATSINTASPSGHHLHSVRDMHLDRTIRASTRTTINVRVTSTSIIPCPRFGVLPCPSATSGCALRRVCAITTQHRLSTRSNVSMQRSLLY